MKLWRLVLLFPLVCSAQQFQPLGIFGGPVLSTSLPSAASLPVNTYAFTTDQGLLVDNGSSWSAISSGGGASTFAQLASGDNTSATMTVDTGASLSPINSGTITATSLATLPSQCSGGQFSTGINIYGNANCATPAGSGNISTSGTITTGAVPLFASGTTLSGTVTVSSNSFLGSNGSGFADLTVPQAIGVLDSQTVNAQTGTTYTLALTDENNEVTMSNSSSNTLCIPPNSSVAFPIGTIETIQQIGSGTTTVAPAGESGCSGTGVTIQSPQYGSSGTQTYSMGGAYGFMQMQQVATNTWNVIDWTQPLLGTAFGGTGATSLAGADIATFTGSITSTHCAEWSASGVLEDSGSGCGGSGSGTVNSGTSGQLAYYASSGAAVSGAGTATLDIPTYTGSITSSDCAEWSSSGVLEDAGAACGGSGSAAVITFAGASQSENVTDYYVPGTSGGSTNISGLVPRNGTFTNLYVAVVDGPASGQTYTYTLMFGTFGSVSASSSVTCTISSSSTSCNSTGTQSVTAGEAWSIRLATSATSGSTGDQAIAIELE